MQRNALFRSAVLISAALVSNGCVAQRTGSQAGASEPAPGAAAAVVEAVERTGAGAADTGLPAGASGAAERLASSPRHGEWVMVPAGAGDSVRAWVVYPERRDRAPVVIVVHEIFGVSNWIRGVADQLAADGFIAVAPDFLTGMSVPSTAAGEPLPDSARAAIRNVQPADVNRRIDAAASYAMALPAAKPTYGIMGFCWGGSVAFYHAAHSRSVGASVVYYGSSPSTDLLQRVQAPVLGLYGEDDARVNATIPAADSLLRARGLTFVHHTYAGAGHGFLRAQDQRDGANLAASRRAWTETVGWLRRHLES